jgi:DNA-binding transcriptional LysR family regulator
MRNNQRRKGLRAGRSAAARPPPQEGGRSGQADFIAALVAAGQGVVLLPRVVARALERPGVVRRPLLESDLRWDIAFIWRRDAYLSRAAQAWLELLDESPAP